MFAKQKQQVNLNFKLLGMDYFIDNSESLSELEKDIELNKQLPYIQLESFKEIFLQQFPVARFFGGPLGVRIRHTAKLAHTFR